MRKQLMLIGLAAALMTACGPKEPPMMATPPQTPPAAAAPDTAQKVEAPDTAAAAASVQGVQVKKKTPSAGMPSGSYAIQVAAWDTRESAEQLAQFFQSRGYEARVENADLESGRWYRVRLGNYASYGEAEKAAGEIQEKYKSNTWLVRL
jgi:cell division septation protein DedD